MNEHDDDSQRRAQLRKLAPLFVIGGLALFCAPLFHPNNTCKDWLQKWGQLAASRMWIPIHQVASLGFALGAGAGLLLCIIGPRRASGFFGGAAFAVGYVMMSMMALMHASAASTIGVAYNAATTDADRAMLRTIATAFVSYDVAVDGVAAVLLSGGGVLLVWYLWRIGTISRPFAIVLAGDAAIWGVQYYRLLRIVHYSFPEWVPYTSQGLLLCAIGITLAIARVERVSIAVAAPAEA